MNSPALRRVGDDDLAAAVALHAEVLAALDDPQRFRLFGGCEAFVRSHVRDRGLSLGAFDGARMLAYGALTLPAAADADNYAADLGWPAERAGRVALLSAAMVAPDQRRRGWHGALIRARIAHAAKLGVDDLLVRAAPANAVSRATLLRHGFMVVWLGVQAEGSLRHVFWRPAGRPAAAGEVEAWVGADDLAAQQAALARGLIGACQREADAAIGFGRPP